MRSVFYFAILFISCQNTPKSDQTVIENLPKDTIAKTDISVQAAPITITKEDEKRIEEEQFGNSAFRDLDCCREFWSDQKGPDCCCESLLNNYKEVIKGKSAKQISAINTTDPLIYKCRNKVKGWGARFDEVTNPKSETGEDDGI